MKTEVCPDRDSLTLHLIGKLQGDTASTVDLHLANCDRCRLVLREIDAEDELTLMMRSNKPRFEGNISEVERIIERGKLLQSEAETVEADETVFSEEPLPADAVLDGALAGQELSSFDEIDFLAEPQQADEIGRLGSYRILEVLGVGGMGIVFRAEDPKLQRQIALKAMKPAIAASRSARERFVREAQATAAIEHDNIVSIYQVDEDRSIPLIAMQFLRGESLQQRLERGQPFDQNDDHFGSTSFVQADGSQQPDSAVIVLTVLWILAKCAESALNGLRCPTCEIV